MPGFEIAETLTVADIAVICPIAEEWDAIRRRITSIQEPADPTDTALPSFFGNLGGYSTIGVLCGKGQGNSATAIQHVCTKWRPKWVFLVGIAGGISEAGVRRGDVVVANFVYAIDFGKTQNGKYIRRPEYDFKPDRSLLAYADLLCNLSEHPWQNNITLARPDGASSSESKGHIGYVASSDKVVDDLGQEMYRIATDTITELHAIEMEAVGAGAAIHLAQSNAHISFLMVRGISDEPAATGANMEATGTGQRKEWKRYAAHAAAVFVEKFLMFRRTYDQQIESEDNPKAEIALNHDVSSVVIEFTEVAESAIVSLSALKEQIVELLRLELKGHPILLKLDYESQPRALRNDHYVLMSKVKNVITIETVSRAMPRRDIYESFTKLSAYYSRAYALKFRIDHTVLVNIAEFRRTFNTLQHLIVQLIAFVEMSRTFSDESIFHRLHDMKNQAIKTLERSEAKYCCEDQQGPANPELGEVAIGFDSVISLVHKILLEVTLPK